MYKHFFKRVLSFLIALVALLLIWWFLAIVAIWLHFANKGAGVFFFQNRTGKNGKVFRVIKFKTMTDERDDEGRLLPDYLRLTKVGKLVRSTSIDELPQLINVLKGDMSLIGPRPLLTYYYDVFTDFEKRRVEVRPGISGWAQVHGRNNCMLSKKFEYDVWYVDHCSFWVDIKIIYLTVINVLKRSGIGDGSDDMQNVDDINLSQRIREYREKNSIQRP